MHKTLNGRKWGTNKKFHDETELTKVNLSGIEFEGVPMVYIGNDEHFSEGGVDYTEVAILFSNDYDPVPIIGGLAVRKVVLSNSLDTTNELTFTVKPDDTSTPHPPARRELSQMTLRPRPTSSTPRKGLIL